MIVLAKWTVVLFGLFIIGVGFLMLSAPQQARKVLMGAGSTNFINYAEITIRMLPAAALIVYAEFSRYPAAFSVLGWFMLMTSVVLYFVPRKMHHSYSLKSADILKPVYIRFLAPFALVFGSAVIYCVF